jgi:hypothetical protein
VKSFLSSGPRPFSLNLRNAVSVFAALLWVIV